MIQFLAKTQAGCRRLFPRHLLHRIATLAFIAVVGLSTQTLSFAESKADSATRPNIVLILADDMGYGDLGCYGRTDIRTPNLDRLASDGVRLTNHYANGAECTPTRAAFLTGRYQQWIGGLECAIGTGNVGRYDDAIRLRETNDLGLPGTETTIAQLLSESGYSTAITGKWHLGYEPKFAPNHHGFQQTFYCIGGGMDYFHYLDTVAGYNLFRDGNPVSGEGHFTDLATEEAIKFLNHQSSDQPFFLYLPYTCPHSPFQGPDDVTADPIPLDSPLWNQGSAPPETYIAMIEHMDQRIGDVLKTLSHNKFDENTVVIFASDNGGTKSARNAPLSGHKGSTFEGGIRVPGIIRWPGKIPPQTTSDLPCLTFDFTRSIAQLAGVSRGDGKPFEGIDIIQAIIDGDNQHDRKLYWRKQRGTKVWKAVRDGQLKYVSEQSPQRTREYLFDLTADVGEQNDLKETHRVDFNRLRESYHHWEKRVRQNRRGKPNTASEQ
ncbi:sulfatase-like hydrolase/transferase [Roseiconus lacunae]|uniref:Sulfatase-like hydrolase/transferase n=1 Tax=Roseiconus lacunae TaxID=2605694 RepID=A0ABT7PF81_9BACT|nr:sulfatase-like hydrolase/transferase [Roseiconus lacunae]MDM4015142.1 sulfatase-like hydrolase/transferase [Roseiconus lacunae]